MQEAELEVFLKLLEDYIVSLIRTTDTIITQENAIIRVRSRDLLKQFLKMQTED